MAQRPGPRPADIAIVGMSAILPGAPDLRSYWENILDKAGAIGEVPPDRWPVSRYFDGDGPDKISSKWGGFLPDTPFDPVHFGIPPASLPSIDPGQLFALLTAEAALADAGLSEIAPELRRRAAVILAFTGGLGELGLQYAARAELARALPETPPETLDFLPAWTSDSFSGLLPNVVAGRIANRFDLGGANFVVDAACASSLAAVRQAVVELESGRSDLVLCGAVETGQGPFAFTCFSKAQALSPGGTCRAFDAAADGTAISEGVAMLVLRRLKDAQAAGDRIYAVIKGVDGSSDGRAKGMMAPLPEGQKRALRRAYDQAGYSPASVDLFEAHGTGTVSGDASEIESLSTLLIEDGAGPRSSAVGSVKTLIGHAEGAAGLAGLIKVVLGLHHKVLPPHAGVETPNAALRRPDCPIALHAQARPWLPRPGQPRRAGVSAFGFGGANYHVTLEEAGAAATRPTRDRWPLELFVWRAADLSALTTAASPVLDALRAGATPHLGGLARALAQNLGTGRATLAIVAGSHEALTKLLAEALVREAGSTRPLSPGLNLSDAPLTADGKVAMLFPGQGSQYLDMGRELATLFDEVGAALAEADADVAQTPTYRDRADPRLSRLIYPFERFSEDEEDEAQRALAQTDVAQPALGAVEVGMLALANRLGLAPSVVAGHSYGEYVALHAAGVLSRADLMRVSEARGRCIVGATRDGDLGTMAAISAAPSTVRAALAESDIVLANLNAPKQTVISGGRVAITAAMERLAAAKLSAVPIAVSAAFHSPLMQPAQAPLVRFFDEIAWAPPRLPVYANTSAAPHANDAAQIRALLERHLTEPVDFMGMVEAMYAAGQRVFLEVGPKSVLTGLVRRILGARPHCAVALDGVGGGLAGLLHALAALMVQGVTIDLARLFEGRTLPTVDPAQPARIAPVGRQAGWVLNGLRARRIDDPVRSAVAPAKTQQARIPHMHGSDGPGPLDDDPEGGLDRVLAEHHRTMQQFLQMQERLMLAYINGGSRMPRPFSTPRPARPAIPAAFAPPPAAPAAQPSPPPAPKAAASAPAPVAAATDPKALLLKIAAERTGYPENMLGLDLNMEADLGIDSIKRVEILGAFRKAQPDAISDHLQPRMTQIAKSATLQEVLDHVGAALSEGPKAEANGAARPFDHAGEEPRAATLPRHVMRPVAEALAAQPGKVAPGIYLVLPDRAGVAATLTKLLERDGAQVRLVPDGATDDAAIQAWLAAARAAGRIRGFVSLTDVAPDAEWRAGMTAGVKALFPLLRLGAPDLTDGSVTIASTMGGLFGRDALTSGRKTFAGAGGGVGLVTCLAMEWPDCRCKAVDLDPAESVAQRAAHLHAEIAASGGRREIGYPAGTRTIFRSELSVLDTKAPRVQPDKDWVVLAVGGARGITAETLRPFAAAGATCILVGRSSAPGPEAPATVPLADAQALRAHFIAAAAKAGERPTPAAIQARIGTVLRDREARANRADLVTLGGRVEDRVCDVTKDAAVAALLDEIYVRHGRLDALLFGAGLIEDRLITDKTRDSLDRVFDTKVDGAHVFAERLRPETLKFVALFTSVAGRYGNRGQTDYGAANEVLNRYAWELQARFGPGTKVTAINWGPWARTTNGPGMLTPETTRQFRERGLSLIEPAEGRDFLWNECVYAPRDEVEVVAWELPEGAADGDMSLVGAQTTERKVA